MPKEKISLEQAFQIGPKAAVLKLMDEYGIPGKGEPRPEDRDGLIILGAVILSYVESLGIARSKIRADGTDHFVMSLFYLAFAMGKGSHNIDQAIDILVKDAIDRAALIAMKMGREDISKEIIKLGE